MKNKKLPPAVVLGMTATGLSAARSLGRKGIKVYGFDSKKHEPGIYSRFVKPVISPNPISESQKFINFLISFGERLSHTAVILCCSDEFLSVISKNRDMLRPYYKFNIPSETIVDSFLDKRKSYQIAKANDLMCPSTYFVENEPSLMKIKEVIKFPCGLKPAITHLWRIKQGGKKLIPVNSFDDLLSEFNKIKKIYSEIMIQELIPGKDDQIYACCLYFDNNGELLASFTKRKLRQHPIHFGISSISVSEINNEIMSIALEFLKKIRYTGMAAMELKKDQIDGKYKFTELNMRFLMSGELAIASGIDFPYIMYADLLGEKIDNPHNFKEDIKLVNLELDLGSFWQYLKAGEITLWEYIKSFKCSRLAHTYFALDDLLPGLVIAFRFSDTLIKKIQTMMVNFLKNLTPANISQSPLVMKKIYNKLPVPIRNASKYIYSFIPVKIRYGNRFLKELEFLEQSQWWSKQEIENYQDEQICRLISHAYRNAPYYRKIFDENKLRPYDIKHINDLWKIPTLDKDIVKKDIDSFLARNYDKRSLVHIATSGTSGNVLDIYSDSKIEFINGGPFEWRFYNWGGYNFDDLCAVFRAQFLKRSSFGRERCFEYNPLQKKIFFSIYDMNERNLNQYIYALKTYDIDVIQGYPSNLVRLIKLLSARGIANPITPKAIFTISETVLPEQRRMMEDYFGCKVFDWYGMEERAVVACECEMHSGLHINSEFGTVEFIETNFGKNIYEIVATGFINYAMPFIRYKTGDYAIPINTKCDCGRNLPLMKLLGGRTRSFIEDANGDLKIVIYCLDKFSAFIDQYQYIQKEKGNLDIKVVCKKYDKKKETMILNELKKEFGYNFRFNIIPVDEIKGRRGEKTPLVLSGAEK